MAIPNMLDEQMRDVLSELEQAVHNHDQWAETLYGTLICRLTPDERDISGDAHFLCRFGQWYYKVGDGPMSRLPGFAEIGLEHERMHRQAAGLLQASIDGVPISIGDYERFVSAFKRLRLEIASAQHEIQTMLFNVDPLTGALNRVDMLNKLREQLEFVRRGRDCSIAMMDIDLFKSVNDRYGHIVGDKVLIEFTQYIKAHLRPYDKLFRYGGEEFLILMPDSDVEASRAVIDRLRGELAMLPIEANGAEHFHVTASFGIAALAPDLSAEQSIDLADKALYAAKVKGRNCVVTWDGSMDNPIDNAR